MVGRTFLIVGLFMTFSGSIAGLYLIWLPSTVSLRSRNPMTIPYVEMAVRRRRRENKPPGIEMEWVSLEKISPSLVRAVLIAEDDRFFEHKGVDWQSFWVAVRHNWEKGKMERGASTITQQVARNLFLSPSKSIWRKVREILIARHLERSLGKERILEIYLNVVELGDGIFGVEAASQRYFNKPASALSSEEAVQLAAALPSPYVRHPNAPASERLQKLRQLYLHRLERYGPIDGNLRE